MQISRSDFLYLCFFSPPDLATKTFFRQFRTDAVGSNYTMVPVHGGQDDQSHPGVEVYLPTVFVAAPSITEMYLSRLTLIFNTLPVYLTPLQIPTTGKQSMTRI